MHLGLGNAPFECSLKSSGALGGPRAWPKLGGRKAQTRESACFAMAQSACFAASLPVLPWHGWLPWLTFVDRTRRPPGRSGTGRPAGPAGAGGAQGARPPRRARAARRTLPPPASERQIPASRLVFPLSHFLRVISSESFPPSHFLRVVSSESFLPSIRAADPGASRRRPLCRRHCPRRWGTGPAARRREASACLRRGQAARATEGRLGCREARVRCRASRG